MATVSSSRLVTKFKDADGKAISKSFSHANPEVTDNQVKAFMNACISQGADVFNDVPAHRVSAQLVTTTTKDMAVED
ncbi:MAG: DUF2922 family protein [Synergistaceae bacterium]|nr:DUF2922 family protein [Synergistaceae bacterium]